ncbi:hypothetical protein HMPREF0889_0288 [Megasphaera lornae]|uniref:Uncharacterized protein n=2 Tax=Megasphaera lornae TaxID=1000568 RepID=D3LVG4_9FIRM|nr:hypothetical protein HMPREF0889_0288 [Megasphaera genomosp. type_1 str. 28L]
MCMNPLKLLFGGGGGVQKVPVIAPTAPPPTMTNVQDSTGGADIADAVRRAKKKRGFSSTVLKDWQSQDNTILGKKTLG